MGLDVTARGKRKMMLNISLKQLIKKDLDRSDEIHVFPANVFY